MRCHRREDISDGNDSRPHEDVSSLQAPRVAAAIKTLMVLEDHLGDRLGKRNFRHDVVPSLAVCLYYLELGRTESSRTTKYLGGNGDLPDVVEGRCHFDPLHLFVWQDKFASNGDGDLRHLSLVPGGIGVSKFDHVCCRHGDGIESGFEVRQVMVSLGDVMTVDDDAGNDLVLEEVGGDDLQHSGVAGGRHESNLVSGGRSRLTEKLREACRQPVQVFGMNEAKRAPSNGSFRRNPEHRQGSRVRKDYGAYSIDHDNEIR